MALRDLHGAIDAVWASQHPKPKTPVGQVDDVPAFNVRHLVSVHAPTRFDIGLVELVVEEIRALWQREERNKVKRRAQA